MTFNPNRYTATLSQEGCPSITITVISSSSKLAKDKALYLFSRGLPFITFGRRNKTPTEIRLHEIAYGDEE